MRHRDPRLHLPDGDGPDGRGLGRHDSGRRHLLRHRAEPPDRPDPSCRRGAPTSSSTEITLFELLKTAKHPKFKDIAKLVK